MCQRSLLRVEVGHENELVFEGLMVNCCIVLLFCIIKWPLDFKTYVRKRVRLFERVGRLLDLIFSVL